MILYSSGRLVHDGSPAAKKLLEGVLEAAGGFDLFFGADEAGKGEWYGPLVVACAAVRPDEFPVLRELGVRDSKALSRKRILEAAGGIIDAGIGHRQLALMPKSYNLLYAKLRGEDKKLNDLLAWAHAKNIKTLAAASEYEKARLTVDRFDHRKTEVRLAGLDERIEVIQKTHAESELEVAAASVLAKFFFERRVDELDSLFGLDLRKMKPSELEPSLLPNVAKLHFKNVS
jgi:ribonuclease HIII